jgi:YD repeat-containing protein
VPGNGYQMKVMRAYKSRSLYNGIFGFGWCSSFETKLEVTAEGNIKITECGDGQVTVYSSQSLNQKNIDGAIAQIITKIKADEKGKILSADYYKKLSADLYTDDVRRLELAVRYKLIPTVKEGIKYSAIGNQAESVSFNKQFYTRYLQDGSYQRFNQQGKLIYGYDKSQNFIKYIYDKDLLVSVEDNNLRKLKLKYFPLSKSNKKQLVQQVSGPNGLLTEYKYSPTGDLIWNKNAWAKSDADVYSYDYNQFHNLTKVTWPDKTFIEIKYDNAKDWVLSFTDRNKCIENYNYEFAASEPQLHYWTTLTKACGRDQVAKNRTEFWHDKSNLGDTVLTRLLKEVDGVSTDITYDPLSGKVLTINNGGKISKFDYNSDGSMKSKLSKDTKIEWVYDPTSKKTSSIKKTGFDEKGKVISTVTTSYQYNAQFNITSAEVSDGLKLKMTYDTNGRVASITDQDKKVVKVEYEDRFGKPSMVTYTGLGSAQVSYNSNGEVSKISSPEGSSVALQVLNSFNQMLNITNTDNQDIYSE